jgi:hypothetical protein
MQSGDDCVLVAVRDFWRQHNLPDFIKNGKALSATALKWFKHSTIGP